ncbi:unnamed protein product, partial [Allacma fusca]
NNNILLAKPKVEKEYRYR